MRLVIEWLKSVLFRAAVRELAAELSEATGESIQPIDVEFHDPKRLPADGAGGNGTDRRSKRAAAKV